VTLGIHTRRIPFLGQDLNFILTGCHDLPLEEDHSTPTLILGYNLKRYTVYLGGHCMMDNSI